MTNARLTASFLNYCHRKGLAPSTIDARRRRLDTLADEIAPTPLADATRDQLQAHLDARPHLAPKSKHALMSDLACFYRWAHAEGHIPSNPAANVIRPRVPRYLPRPVTDAQLDKALRCAGDPMRAWLVLAAYAGLRTMEIAGLDGTDIIPADGLLRVVGKGRRERIIPMHPAVAAELRRLDPPTSGPVFVRPLSGKPWTPHHLGAAVNTHLRDCGINATGHQLRHWFASRVHAASGDLRVTQELLGHASPQTTAIYASWSRSDARRAVSALT